GPHWRGHQWTGGDAGSVGLRLFLRPVSLPAASPARPRPLVLPPHVQFPLLLLLQELRLHAGSFLVRIPLWFLCP
ncbi:hypothetical protein M9458_049142, partial [Cirrhinus mrigala]